MNLIYSDGNVINDKFDNIMVIHIDSDGDE